MTQDEGRPCPDPSGVGRPHTRTHSASRGLSSGRRDLSGVGRTAYIESMCRNIRQLHNFEPPATTDEVYAAALQYVRKVSGSTKPSQANQEAFDEAVRQVAVATQHLLDHLVTSAPPKDREVEAAKAKARAAERYGRAG